MSKVTGISAEHIWAFACAPTKAQNAGKEVMSSIAKGPARRGKKMEKENGTKTLLKPSERNRVIKKKEKGEVRNEREKSEKRRNPYPNLLGQKYEETICLHEMVLEFWHVWKGHNHTWLMTWMISRKIVSSYTPFATFLKPPMMILRLRLVAKWWPIICAGYSENDIDGSFVFLCDTCN